jgi:signal transduction histidine kinase
MKIDKLAEFREHRFYKYFASFLIVCIATFVQHLLWPLVNPAPFLFFYPAVIFASIYGDGNFAIFLSMISAQYFFITPYLELDISWPDDYVRQLVFFFSVYTLRRIVHKEIEQKLRAEAAVESLQEEKDIREKFVSTLTHDLQTPLTGAKLSVQLLMRHPDEATTQKNGERILNNLTRIEHMIRDLLDSNKIRAGKKLPLSIIEMDMGQCVRSTITELTAVHGTRFTVEAPEKVMGHWCEDAIRRITENLCSNAVKYGAEATPITIFIEEEPDTIHLKVHNHGDTIPHHKLDLMFNPYERLKTEDRTYKKGWGLGLTLVKGLSEAQGGKVSVTSDHHGTTFMICLPRDVRQYVEVK